MALTNITIQSNRTVYKDIHTRTHTSNALAYAPNFLMYSMVRLEEDETRTVVNYKCYFQYIDPLIVPQRRETSHRKAKGRSILNALQKQPFGSDNQNDDDEPPEFVDSDSDPAWTPQKVV